MKQSAESAISDYFASQGARFEDEQQIIGAITSQHVLAHGHVTNKIIILQLIRMLETSENIIQQDVLRSALEIVLGRTEDDSGF